MPTYEVWWIYTTACILVVLSPGPDNLLAIGRGLSQGSLAAIISGASSGMGVVFHVFTATLGLTLLIQTSLVAFWVVKIVGACYLIQLGIKVLRSRSLINFQHAKRQSFRKIFMTGFLSAALSPEPGLFVLAFIPQFIQPNHGSATVQMVVLGLWFAVLTTVGFSLMGMFASQLSSWLRKKPRVVVGLNVGAGLTFIASGVSIAALNQK